MLAISRLITGSVGRVYHTFSFAVLGALFSSSISINKDYGVRQIGEQSVALLIQAIMSRKVTFSRYNVLALTFDLDT